MHAIAPTVPRGAHLHIARRRMGCAQCAADAPKFPAIRHSCSLTVSKRIRYVHLMRNQVVNLNGPSPVACVGPYPHMPMRNRPATCAQRQRSCSMFPVMHCRRARASRLHVRLMPGSYGRHTTGGQAAVRSAPRAGVQQGQHHELAYSRQRTASCWEASRATRPHACRPFGLFRQ